MYRVVSDRDISREVLDARVRAIKSFMYLSVAFVVIGLLFQFKSIVEGFIDPEIEVLIDVTPSEAEGYLLKVGSDVFDKPIEVTMSKGKRQIHFKIDKMVRNLERLQDRLKQLDEYKRKVQESALTQASSESERASESGL